LREWYRTVKATDWTCFADVRLTYPRADLVGNKVIFDVGGNKHRLIVVIDYEGHKVFVRHVLNHKDYEGELEEGRLGMDWKPRTRVQLVGRAHSTHLSAGLSPLRCRRNVQGVADPFQGGRQFG
jgi:mRNA interferase HigB